jgi:pimeloyl-ACP methyl ester carboxylesterase
VKLSGWNGAVSQSFLNLRRENCIVGQKDVMTEECNATRTATYRRDGVTLGYSVVGDGQPIVFVHGATATGEFEWARLAARLAPRYRCILPDLRGHGRSDFRASDNTGDEIRADLLHLIDHLGLDRPHIVGFSYGSEIALMLELSRPGTAGSLVLISPGTGRPADYRIPRLEDLHRTWPFALRRLHEVRHGPEHWRVLVSTLHADSATRSELSTETLAAVGCPVLLLAGEHDERTRRTQGQRFAQAKPQARYVEIVGATHAAHHERPDEVYEVIEDFLAGVDVEKAGSPWRSKTQLN